MSLKFITCIAFLLSLSVLASAQAQDSGEYDPLKERLILPLSDIPNYREDMRNLVITLSEHAKKKDSSFIIAIKGGEKLLYRGKWENLYDELAIAQKYHAKTQEEIFIINLFSEQSDSQKLGSASRRFAKAINGIMLENKYCHAYPLASEALSAIKDFNLTVMSEEICPPGKLAAIQKQSAAHAVPLYNIPVKEAAFKTIPEERPFMENADNINTLKDVRNILVLTDTSDFPDKKTFLNRLAQTSYDLLVIKPFFQDREALTAEEVYDLKFKKNGAKRLVLGALNVATVKDTDFLWKRNWKLQNPSWLRKISDTEEGAVVTEYWNPEWQRIIGHYFTGIVFLGFDGAFINDVNRHLEFEELTPIDY